MQSVNWLKKTRHNASIYLPNKKKSSLYDETLVNGSYGCSRIDSSHVWFFYKRVMPKKEKIQKKGVTVLIFEIRCIENHALLEAFILFHDPTLELSVIITGDI